MCMSNERFKQAKLSSSLTARKRSSEGVSPVDGTLLFGHHGLKVGELQEAVVEVVKVKNAHQQEGGGDENPGEQQRQAKSLQAQVVQAGGGREEKQEAVGTRTSAELRASEENPIGFSGSKVAIGDRKLREMDENEWRCTTQGCAVEGGRPYYTTPSRDSKRKIFVSNLHFWLHIININVKDLLLFCDYFL